MAIEYHASFQGPQKITTSSSLPLHGPAFLGAGAGKYSVQSVVGGTAPSTFKAVLEGSNDGGLTWAPLTTWDITVVASGVIVGVKDIPVQYVRISVTTLTGGDATTSIGTFGAASR
jgi:hypothetical protein